VSEGSTAVRGPKERRIGDRSFEPRIGFSSFCQKHNELRLILFAVCLKVFFGKRFDHHGFLETQSILTVPSLRSIDNVWNYDLPQFNFIPRPELGLDLNIAHLAKIRPMLDGKVERRALNMFFTAGGYYTRSLSMLYGHRENAYLDLVAAGEVLAGYDDLRSAHLVCDFSEFPAAAGLLFEGVRHPQQAQDLSL
jgi:hypothetical protein